MIPEGNPHGRVAGKSCRDPKFKEAFAIRLWQPLSSQHLLPFIGTSEDVHVEVWFGVSSLCENPPSSGPSEPRVGLVCFVGNRERNAATLHETHVTIKTTAGRLTHIMPAIILW